MDIRKIQDLLQQEQLYQKIVLLYTGIRSSNQDSFSNRAGYLY